MTELQATFVDMHQHLIERCKNNDPKAQMEVYKLYYKAMFNTCLRIVKDNMLAEDVMQEAFLTVFDKIKTYQGQSAFGAWLKRVVVNKALDELKKKKLLFDSLETSVEVYKIEAEQAVSNEYEAEITNKINNVKNALNQLPDGYRIVLSLYLFEGYDHEEISQILKVTESTTRSQLTRAKQKLIDILNKKI
jgi:RNA polymerase sigma factor (sigma-70 family)